MHVALRGRKKSPASSPIGAQNGCPGVCVLRAGRDEGRFVHGQKLGRQAARAAAAQFDADQVPECAHDRGAVAVADQLALTRGFAQELSNARSSVVNLCSIAGYRVHPFAGSACASSMAALASLNVRVNAIAPGEIDTAILSPGTSHIVDTQIPLRRPGTTAEVADLVEFLCSERASYITGAEIPIDGGQRI